MGPNNAIIEIGLILVLVTTLFSHIAIAQSGCTSVLISLSPCLNYVTGSSSTPTSSCCSKLADVVQSQPQCLCSVINGNGVSSLGVTVNQSLAVSLPGACNVQTPPISRCNNAANGSTSSPATSSGVLSTLTFPISPPADTSDEITPQIKLTEPNCETGVIGSKTELLSDGSIIKVSLYFNIFTLFFAMLCALSAIAF